MCSPKCIMAAFRLVDQASTLLDNVYASCICMQNSVQSILNPICKGLHLHVIYIK